MRNALLLLVLASPQVVFGSIDLKIGGSSYHIHTNKHTNNFHRVVNPRYRNFSIGYARNSFDKDIFSVAYYSQYRHRYFNANLHYGAVYGYTSCTGRNYRVQRKTCVLIAPELEFNTVLKPTFTLFANAIVLTVEITELD